MARPSRHRAPGPALRLALGKLLREAQRAIKRFPENSAGQAHVLRTRVKRLQSLCRLVPDGAVWRENFLPPCRELKDLFAETRDATILQSLAEKYAPGQAHHLRATGSPDLLGARERAGLAAGLLADYPRWSELSWDAIADRAVGTYRAARRAWRAAARKNAADAAFHDWRRRVKRLLYQCEYLGGRARLVRFTARVDRLGETLGEIQDICMAEQWLAQQPELSVPPDLARSKETLRREALACGLLLLSPKPREFRRMLG
ncbi:MAG: CHAD domain-containing protein [Chthoniobacterales bacterium]